MNEKMILPDFCDERVHVSLPVKLTGMSVHFVSGGAAPTPEQWTEKRARIVVNRRFTVVDDTLVNLFRYPFTRPFVLLPGMVFEVLADPEVRELVRFEFEGTRLTPTECLNYVELVGGQPCDAAPVLVESEGQ